MIILLIIFIIWFILFVSLIILHLLTKNMDCYAIFCGNAKPKNILEKIRYKIWLMLDVSPSKLLIYMSDKLEEDISNEKK